MLRTYRNICENNDWDCVSSAKIVKLAMMTAMFS